MHSGSDVSGRQMTLVGGRLLFVALLLACELATASVTNSNHWAFKPLVRPTIPATKYANAIDAFVCSATKKGRALAAEADRRTLIRRLSFDLRGLPPATEEVAAFLKDTRRDAFERLVEGFLSSSQYGE